MKKLLYLIMNNNYNNSNIVVHRHNIVIPFTIL